MIRQRGDAGLTLVELLTAAAIAGLILPVVAGAFMVGWRTTDRTVSSLSDTRNRQLVASLFTRDVQGATTVAVSGAACTSAGDTLLVRFAWSETPAAGAATSREVSWVTTASGRVERRSCLAGSAPSSSVSAAHGVTGTPTVVCRGVTGNPVGCGSGVVVELQVTDASGTFNAVGRRRST